jgi:hypothetical protein
LRTWSGFLFTKAQNVSVDVFKIKILAGPGSLLKWLGNPRATRVQILVECFDACHSDVCIEVLMLLAMGAVTDGLRPVFRGQAIFNNRFSDMAIPFPDPIRVRLQRIG